MNEKIEKQEEKDRNECLRLFCKLFKTVQYEVPQNIRSDLYVTATTNNNKVGIYNIEIKQRNCNIDTYKDTILEVSKYEYMMSDTGKTAIYFVIFNDCYAIYNLNKLYINKSGKRLQMMNNITYTNNAHKVYKEVIGLTKENAKIYAKNKETGKKET